MEAGLMYEFGDAELPWIPKLIDVENFKVNSDDTAYWQGFGWEALEVPLDCTYVTQRMTTLKTRFDERYANRMLNSETMERWQVRLQNRFDEVVRRYDRQYELYQRYDQDMKDDIIAGDKTVTESTSQAGGSDTATGGVRNIDTPDEKVNSDTGYAGSRSTSTATNTYGRRDTLNSTVTHTTTGKGVVDGINDSVMSWKDIDTEFVKEFENLFLNVLWY